MVWTKKYKTKRKNKSKYMNYSKDKKQDIEIRKLKQRIRAAEKTKKVKCNIQKWTMSQTNYTGIYTPNKKLFYFSTQDVEDNVAYAPQIEMTDGRKSDKITVLRTKCHIKLDALRPGTQYRIMLIKLDDYNLDMNTGTEATQKAGFFLRYAGFDVQSSSLVNKDVPEMIINSPLNYEDVHEFKVLSDNVYTAGSNQSNSEALDSSSYFNPIVRYHTININHKKKNGQGLDLEFTDGQGDSNNNRMYLLIYTNQVIQNVEISGYQENYYTDVS